MIDTNVDTTEFFHGFTQEEWEVAYEEWGRHDETFEEYKKRVSKIMSCMLNDCEDL